MIKKKLNAEFSFSGVIEKRNYIDKTRFGYVRVLLREVRLGKLLFRNHVWVEETKQLSKLKNGTVIKFTATIKEYIDIDNINSFKLGLIKIKRIKKINFFKKIKINNNHYKEYK